MRSVLDASTSNQWKHRSTQKREQVETMNNKTSVTKLLGQLSNKKQILKICMKQELIDFIDNYIIIL